MRGSSPFAERLGQAHDQWVAFANRDDARILIWQGGGGDAALVEAFIVGECDVDTSETPDLFLQLVTPFQSAKQHGFALASELVRLLSEAESADAPNRDAFRAPYRSAEEEDVHFLTRLLAAFRAHAAGEDGGMLAIWLRPSEVLDAAQYVRWLHRLARVAAPEVRFVLLADREDQHYASLAESQRVVLQPCSFDVSSLARVPPCAGTSSESALFRRLQVQLGEMVSAGKVDDAASLATAANDIAAKQGWPHLQVLVQLLLGSGYAGAERWMEALRCYVAAERFAKQCEESPNEESQSMGMRIRLSALLSQGSVLLAQQAYRHGAEVYLKAVSIARVVEDRRSELDGYRLASFCYAELGERALAWETGLRGLGCAVRMDDETRRSSTFAYLAQHMLRLTRRFSEYGAHQPAIDAQATALLGPGWREQLPSTKAS